MILVDRAEYKTDTKYLLIIYDVITLTNHPVSGDGEENWTQGSDWNKIRQNF